MGGRATGWREQFGLSYWLNMRGGDGSRRKQRRSWRGFKEVGPGICRTGVVWMLLARSVDNDTIYDSHRTV